MGSVSEYRKAIGAALGGLVGLVALFIPGVADTLGPEVIAAIATVLATVLAYKFPNSRGGVNVSDLADVAIKQLGEEGAATMVRAAKP
jgi:hypothetical protein